MRTLKHMKATVFVIFSIGGSACLPYAANAGASLEDTCAVAGNRAFSAVSRIGCEDHPSSQKCNAKLEEAFRRQNEDEQSCLKSGGLIMPPPSVEEICKVVSWRLTFGDRTSLINAMPPFPKFGVKASADDQQKEVEYHQKSAALDQKIAALNKGCIAAMTSEH